MSPGVSRTGATLAAARALGYSRAEASRLSFGVAGPVLAGATALKAWRGRPWTHWRVPAAGAAAAFVATRVALRAFGVERREPLWPYAARERGALLARRQGRPILARAVPSKPVSTDAYARSGVDQHAADRAVAALVGVLKTIDPGRASRSVLASGHYAAVLEVAPNLGIAVGTDGVGSKLILAEQTGRYDTVGIDCVAMNVNDVVCVGAEPIALLDYLAVERADPDVMEQIGIGLKRGRRAGRRRDPRRRGGDPARADPRPSVAERVRPDRDVLRHRRAGRRSSPATRSRPATR